MSGREQSHSSGEQLPSGGPHLSGLEPDQVEAIRLADMLSAAEADRPSMLDPIEDPELAALVATAGDLRTALEAATAHASFGAFQQRSRARVMAATPSPRPVQLALQEPRGSIFDRWAGLFTSIAAAAAASIATFVVTVAAMGGGPGSPAVVSTEVSDSPETVAASDAATEEAAAPVSPPQTNLTALSTSQVMAQWRVTLERITAATNDGEPVGVTLLDDLIDASSSVAARIQRDPDSVSGAEVFAALHAGKDSEKALAAATVSEPEAQQALDTAQLTSEGAMVIAARFLDEHPDRRPSADEAAAALVLAVPSDDGTTGEGAGDGDAPADEGEPASEETDATIQAEPQP